MQIDKLFCYTHYIFGMTKSSKSNFNELAPTTKKNNKNRKRKFEYELRVEVQVWMYCGSMYNVHIKLDV